MASQLLVLSSDTIISPVQEQISSELAGEAVLLQLSSGIYYGLNKVGSRIWELIQQPKRFSEVLDTLLEEYDVQPEICKQELTRIVMELRAAELVEVTNETP